MPFKSACEAAMAEEELESLLIRLKTVAIGKFGKLQEYKGKGWTGVKSIIKY
jgi:hypothetical protein